MASCGLAGPISAHHSISDIAIGLPGGASLERTINFIPTDAVAHNFYVDTYLNFGLPGLAALVTLLVIVWRGRARIAKATGLSVTIVALILLVQIVYGGGYALDAGQGLILGLFVAALAAAVLRNLPFRPFSRQVTRGMLLAGPHEGYRDSYKSQPTCQDSRVPALVLRPARARSRRA